MIEDAPLPSLVSPITCRYLLVINIPLYRNAGVMLAEHLWFKDLLGHLDYLKKLTIACPIMDDGPVENAVQLSSDHRFAAVNIAELPAAGSWWVAAVNLPRTTIRLWKAIRDADIVHTGLAGWPFPYGWVATPIAKILRKKLVIIVESAPWRLNSGRARTFKAVFLAWLYEGLARWCLARSDLAIFTQENYRQTLLPNERTRARIINASWIDEEVIISAEQADEIWNQKSLSSATELSIVFVGRLDRQKGLLVLLDAMRLLATKNLPVRLDILGAGELEPVCRALSQELKDSTRVHVLGTVPYGAPLFEMLRGYHALVLPNISDEQPRIVYDAYSQALPVLASRTSGLEACIVENRTGWFVAPNSADELGRMIERAAANAHDLESMGKEALRSARSMTHQKMHRDRHRLLLELIR
jgi:glycosyltransferase involved in cell wall biosynthesis